MILIKISEDIDWDDFLRELIDFEIFPDNLSVNNDGACASAYVESSRFYVDILEENRKDFISITVYKDEDDPTTVVVRLFFQYHPIRKIYPTVDYSKRVKYMKRICQIVEQLTKSYDSAKHRDWTRRG